MKRLAVSGGLLLCVVAGCAGAEEPVNVDVDTDQVAERIATATDIEHACEHAQSTTPYTNMSPTATASASSPTAIEHGAYHMTFGAQGWVKFTADETAEYGIYTDPSITGGTLGICVKKSNAAGTGTTGNCLTKAYEVAISATTCPADGGHPTYGTPDHGLSYVRTWNLTAGQAYFVQFLKSGTDPIYANFENLNEQ